MTREDILELGARRRHFAMVTYGSGLAMWTFTLCLAASFLWTQRLDSQRALLFNNWGLGAMSLGYLLLNVLRLCDERAPNRYVSGPLVINRQPLRLALFALADLLLALGYGLSGISIFNLGRAAENDVFTVGFALLFTACVVGSIIIANGHLWHLLRRGPVVTVSEEGFYAADAMRGPVSWDDIESLPVAPSGTSLMLALKTRNAKGGVLNFLRRPLGSKASHLVHAWAVDEAQADILLAIAHFRPALVEALSLPKGVGPARTISPARS